MHFIDETGGIAGWNVGFQPDGREVVIIAIKKTYTFPELHPKSAAAAMPQVSGNQVELVLADEFTGEPGQTAPLFETDYSLFKPACDIMLSGTAYSPGGKPVENTPVRMQVGPLNKTIAVHGNRQWRRTGTGLRPSRAQLFNEMPISYDNAFGGVDRTNEAKGKTDTFTPNPVGCGYYTNSKTALGQALPNTEEFRNPVRNPNGKYLPMAFGPIGRSWFPRYKFAGTYDQKWMDERAPILPRNFDNRYYQATAPDQQLPYLRGGEQVVLQNLTKEGLVSFCIPQEKMPVLFVPHRGEEVEMQANIDTIMFEPDKARFSMTWRANYPLYRDCFDVKEVIAGVMPRSWHSKRRAQRLAKQYYPGLRAMVKARRKGLKK